MKLCAILVACSWLVSLHTGFTQRRPAAAKPDASGTYKLLSVKATGSARYTDKEILVASGLQLGKPAAETDFKEAAQQLLGSGMFTDVAYTFSYSEAGTKVEFQLTDLDKTKLVPARFENFVGVDDAELRTFLEQTVALFHGDVPLTGQLTDQITHALQGLLDQRHLPGEVDSSREGGQEDAPPTAIIFRLRGLSIRIRAFEFPGATPDQTASLENAVRRMVGGEYSDPLMATEVKTHLLPVLLEHGYLKAAFGSPETRVVSSAPENGEPSSSGPSSGEPSSDASSSGGPSTGQTSSGEQSSAEVEVDVTLPVTAGKQYSLTGVDWKGNSAIPQNQAASLFHLVIGQPADAAGLERDVAALIELYHSRGYMTVKIDADPVIDEKGGTVRYKMNTVEGDLYRMGELEFLGLDSGSKDRLLNAWKLPEGQPYNPDYTRKFLADVPQLLPHGSQYTTKLSEDLDAKVKVVDVTIHFKGD
jgi:outer membrane protein assembly factor BamA